MKLVGPSFLDECYAAGLMGAPIVVFSDGTWRADGLTADQQTTFDNVLAAHDPTKPGPAPITIVAKVDLFRRMTDAEYASMQSALTQQPARTQAIFNGADTFRSDAPEWTQLQSMATQLYGSDRAAQLLAPST